MKKPNYYTKRFYIGKDQVIEFEYTTWVPYGIYINLQEDRISIGIWRFYFFIGHQDELPF